MSIFVSKTKTIYLFILFLIFNYLPIFSNPFLPFNLLEFLFNVLVSVILFTAIHIITLNKNNKFSKNFISYSHTIFIIGIAFLLFFNDIQFPKQYNFYIPRVICIFFIVIWLLFLIYICKKIKINYAIPLIIFIPYLIQSIAMINHTIAFIYLKYPILNAIFMLSGIAVYQLILVNKYKK